MTLSLIVLLILRKLNWEHSIQTLEIERPVSESLLIITVELQLCTRIFKAVTFLPWINTPSQPFLSPFCKWGNRELSNWSKVTHWGKGPGRGAEFTFRVAGALILDPRPLLVRLGIMKVSLLNLGLREGCPRRDDHKRTGARVKMPD